MEFGAKVLFWLVLAASWPSHATIGLTVEQQIDALFVSQCETQAGGKAVALNCFCGGPRITSLQLSPSAVTIDRVNPFKTKCNGESIEVGENHCRWLEAGQRLVRENIHLYKAQDTLLLLGLGDVSVSSLMAKGHISQLVAEKKTELLNIFQELKNPRASARDAMVTVGKELGGILKEWGKETFVPAPVAAAHSQLRELGISRESPRELKTQTRQIVEVVKKLKWHDYVNMGGFALGTALRGLGIGVAVEVADAFARYYLNLDLPPIFGFSTGHASTPQEIYAQNPHLFLNPEASGFANCKYFEFDSEIAKNITPSIVFLAELRKIETLAANALKTQKQQTEAQAIGIARWSSPAARGGEVLNLDRLAYTPVGAALNAASTRGGSDISQAMFTK